MLARRLSECQPELYPPFTSAPSKSSTSSNPAPRPSAKADTFDYCALSVQSDSRIPIQAPGGQLGACSGRNGRSEEGLRQAGLPE